MDCMGLLPSTWLLLGHTGKPFFHTGLSGYLQKKKKKKSELRLIYSVSKARNSFRRKNSPKK